MENIKENSNIIYKMLIGTMLHYLLLRQRDDLEQLVFTLFIIRAIQHLGEKCFAIK